MSPVTEIKHRPERATALELPPGHDVVEFRGNHMPATFRPGTMLIVDSTDQHPAEGYMMIDRGIGEEVRRISGCDKLGHVRVSIDREAFPAYAVAVADLRIAGRVVARIDRLF